MPDHPTGDDRASTAPRDPSAACPLAAMCVPTISVLPRLAAVVVADAADEYLPSTPPVDMVPQEAPSPPFHPPRA